jgi:orotate phosphoribosyltransferase
MEDKIKLEINKKIIKRGEYTLKDGSRSAYYFDFRYLISDPMLMNLIADALAEKVKMVGAELLVGIPYASLPIASVMSSRHDIPMVYL